MVANWFTYSRSQDDVNAVITVNYGIDVANELPARPILFLIVTSSDRQSEPAREATESAMHADLERGGAIVVGSMTMGQTRTLVAYGADETTARQALGAYDGGIAFQAQNDPEWQIYRTLLPTDGEVAETARKAEPEPKP